MASPDRPKATVQPKTLHGRLTEDLLSRIQRGDWPVGSTLPSETALCEQTGTSRHTLRHTLKTLQERGFLERRQGAVAKSSPAPSPVCTAKTSTL